jgi:putative Mg2+ transporter-C (MgtC) family protein
MNLATFTMNIGCALLMGMAIGLERQFRQHVAGLRTNALVSVGAALFVSLSQLLDKESSPTRIAAQVVSGIGFLGGGVILREGFNVRGMNTAATLWCSAAVGTLAGAGYLVHGALGTVAVLVVHLTLRPFVRRIDAWTKGAKEVETLYRVKVVCADREEVVVRQILMRHVNSQPSMTVQGISTQDADQPGKTAVVAEVFSSERNDRYLNDLVSRISIEPSVTAVSWERVG